MNTRKYTKIDQKMFDCVKLLLTSGAAYSEIEKYTGVGKTAIGRIKSSENYQEYKNILAAIAIEQQKKRKDTKVAEEPVQQKPAEEKPKKPDVLQSTYQMNRLIELINKQNDLIKDQNEILRIMGNKLAFVVEELAGPVKEARA